MKRNKMMNGVGYKIAISLVCVFLSISSCTAKCPKDCGIDDDTYAPSAKLQKSMPPKSVLKRISKSAVVKAYAINALSEDTISEKVCGFCTIGQPKLLKEDQIERIKAIITNDSSYLKKDNVIKYSTFLPDYAFKFVNEKDSVVLFLDFHADMWLFKYKKKEYLFDNETISASLKNLVSNIFNIRIKDSKNAMISQNSPKEKATVKNEASKTDTLKYKNLPSHIINIINDADSLKCYLLDPFADEKTKKILGKYVILLEKPMTDKAVINNLTKQLLEDKSFPDYPYVKNCTFLPDIAFVFYHNNDTLNILFSFYCNECQIVLNNKLEFQNDCGQIQSSIIGIARKVFPKDKYLRTISK